MLLLETLPLLPLLPGSHLVGTPRLDDVSLQHAALQGCRYQYQLPLHLLLLLSHHQCLQEQLSGCCQDYPALRKPGSLTPPRKKEKLYFFQNGIVLFFFLVHQVIKSGHILPRRGRDHTRWQWKDRFAFHRSASNTAKAPQMFKSRIGKRGWGWYFFADVMG